MNRNLVIVMAGGFLIATLVAIMVQASLSGTRKTEAPVPEARTQIIVAARDLSAGDTLTADSLKWQDWPQSAVFPGALVRQADKSVTEIAQGRLRRAVMAGEPVVESALVRESEGNFIAATLREGMRAVAIDTGASKMAGGFIGPGDYVDVMLTYKETVGYKGENENVSNMIELNLDKMATETILQNVRVLAVDQASQRDEEKGVKVGKTITLEVDMRGAEILALARKMGEVSLALRRLGDTTQYEKTQDVITDARLTRVTDEIYGEMVKIENEQNGNIIKIYNGFQAGQASVGR